MNFVNFMLMSLVISSHVSVFSLIRGAVVSFDWVISRFQPL